MANVKELNINSTNYDIIGKGVVNQNSDETNPLKYWTGTTDEYENLQTIDPDTVYVIKDNYTPANVETLFDFKFCDHIIDNVCWVNADNYDWVDGTRYTSAYQHLVDDFTQAQAEQGQLDIQNDTIVPTYSETIGSYTIYYYLAHDEHKIIMPDQATTAENIYAESGISWYYLLDTGNSRFKLPRTKHGFVGYRTAPGEYVPAGLPNITGEMGRHSNQGIAPYETLSSSGAFYDIETPYNMGTLNVSSAGQVLGLDASRSNSIYGNSDTVQPPATQMLLYFYVGNQIINQDMIDVSAINTELTNKADKDLSNIDSSALDIIKNALISQYIQAPTTTGSDSSGGIKLSNGLIICWGYVFLNGVISSTNKRVPFPITYTKVPCVFTTHDANCGSGVTIMVGWQATDGFSIGVASGQSCTGHTSWFSIGY